MKLIKNAKVYTVDPHNKVIKNCDILIERGKIVNIGERLNIPRKVKIIDVTGKIVTPGLIDCHTHVGILGEITDGMRDHNEYSSPYTPLLSAIDAINPLHHSFQDAREHGVTTVQTGNGSHNIVGGVWAVIKTYGSIVEEMVIKKRSGLKGALGENPKRRHGQGRKKAPFTRMSIAYWLRQGFLSAQKILRQGIDDIALLYQNGQEDLQPFLEVLKGKMPLRLHAHRADDIMMAISLAEEFKFNLSIEHGTEAYKIVSHVKEAGFPVVLGPYMSDLGKFEVRDLNMKSPKILHDAGVLIAISTDHPFDPIQYLSVCAAVAVKHGLNEFDALRAITINPAKICGVENRIGSIEIGKDADLVVWSDHPFKSRAKVEYTLIDGQIVYENK